MDGLLEPSLFSHIYDILLDLAVEVITFPNSFASCIVTVSLSCYIAGVSQNYIFTVSFLVIMITIETSSTQGPRNETNFLCFAYEAIIGWKIDTSPKFLRAKRNLPPSLNY